MPYQAKAGSTLLSHAPADKTGEFFGFYAISGKLASIFGPLIFA